MRHPFPWPAPAPSSTLACVHTGGITMKVIGWAVGIIFLVGLLVVTGVLKLIF